MKCKYCGYDCPDDPELEYAHWYEWHKEENEKMGKI